jgi:hypothetical protein
MPPPLDQDDPRPRQRGSPPRPRCATAADDKQGVGTGGGTAPSLLFLPQGEGGGVGGNNAAPSDGGGSPRGRKNVDGSFGIATDATVKDKQRLLAIGGHCH